MKQVRLLDYGIAPGMDITLSLHELFQKFPEDTEFLFENGDYYFSPHDAMRADYRISNSDVMPYRVLAVWMKEMKNCTLSGNGARLWLAGQMQVFTLDHCDNVTVKDFIVNWKKPLVAEGTVVARNGLEVDVFVDPMAFPHRFRDGKLEFDTGADEWYAFGGNVIVFEPHSFRARRGVSDVRLTTVADLGGHVYRMQLGKEADLRIGDLLNMRHNARLHAGVFTEKCRDVTVENVTFFSCGGLGCLAQFCHNLTYRGVHFLPDVASGRRVSSGRDDGMHITCNSGKVTITQCCFHGLMDDPINVHSCCVTSDEVVDERTLRCRYRHNQACGFHYWAEKEDEIVFIARGPMNQIGKAKVERYQLEDNMTFLLTFDRPLPEEILDMARAGDQLALDNLTHTVEFECTNNRFGSCRARGILVSTPKKVRICHNYFESSGSAILVAGDSNYWFESGECNDVEISHNVFTDACLGSIYQFCDGVISICPVVPAPELDKPYHKNIRITGNVFDTVGVPVLYAYSCAGLEFTGNRIFKSPSAALAENDPRQLRLSYCNGVTVRDNLWVGMGEVSCDGENCAQLDVNM